MTISITNIWRTQVIVKTTTIEKIIFIDSKKTLDKCMIETQFLSGHQAIIGIPIVKRPPGDQ